MIKYISASPISEWSAWTKKEIQNPTLQLKKYKEVYKLLIAFDELMDKVKKQNLEEAKSDNNIDSVFMDLLGKEIDKKT